MEQQKLFSESLAEENEGKERFDMYEGLKRAEIDCDSCKFKNGVYCNKFKKNIFEDVEENLNNCSGYQNKAYDI